MDAIENPEYTKEHRTRLQYYDYDFGIGSIALLNFKHLCKSKKKQHQYYIVCNVSHIQIKTH